MSCTVTPVRAKPSGDQGVAQLGVHRPGATLGRAAAAEDEIGPLGEHRIADPGQLSRVERSVGVHEGDDGGRRREQPGVCSRAEPSLRHLHHPGTELLGQFRRSVGRSVVGDNRPVAGRHAGEQPGQRCGLVQARQYDVDLGSHARTVGATRAWNPLQSANATDHRCRWRIASESDGQTAGRRAHAGCHRDGRHAIEAGWCDRGCPGGRAGDGVDGVGPGLVGRGVDLHLSGGPPLTGRYEPRFPAAALAPVLFAACVLWRAPALARRLAWRPLLGVATASAGIWAVLLAGTDGIGAFGLPLTSPFEYLRDVGRFDDLGEFLGTFTAHVSEESAGFHWTTHVGGHPPAALLTFVVLDQLGLGGPGPAAGLCLAVGSSAVAAVLITVRSIGGEELARRAAPFVALSPVALWVATSADALFCGVAAWGVCCLAVAAARQGWSGTASRSSAGSSSGSGSSSPMAWS